MNYSLVSKEKLLFFLKVFLLLVTTLYIFYLFSSLVSPLVQRYIEDVKILITFSYQQLTTLIITAVILYALFYLIKKLYRQVKILFSEETTEHNIYEESLEAWKQKKHDVVYNNMNYVYQIAKRKNLENVYTQTAKAMLLYQKTDYTSDTLNRDEVINVIRAFILPFKEKILTLNTIHLAYAFLHLARREEKQENKTIYHLICYYLFNSVDPIFFKRTIDVEYRIFHAYYEQHQETIQNIIPNQLLERLLSRKTPQTNAELLELISFIEEYIKE